ncbi:hypothetical protein MLD38_030970 [Melastoma candidum]|uniref:Uncharacterized protein n=1 Tax=Melastoma candidum TaxID=119954 RepID=A0ACB9MMX5_9MYRT|nr:hypothetical protein MLD38_030970 [Melastoma candidum]
MLCLEMWYNSILVLLAGYMKNASVAISAFSICLNVAAWEFMICLGFLVGVSVRVSNELGRGNAKAAHFAVKPIRSSRFHNLTEQRPASFLRRGCVVLGYVAHLDVQGIWIGMITGVAIQTLALGTIIWRTNWDAQVEKAAERLSKWKLEDNEPEDSAQEAPNGR